MEKTVVRETGRGRCLVGRVAHGADLLEELTALCRQKRIRLGRVEAVGAVSSARVYVYDQAAREYRLLAFDRPMEIAALAGNVSLKEGEPMVHAHVVLADADGRAWGGHLAPGTVVFACEYVVQEFTGAALEREHDAGTGLSLWKG